MSTQYIGEIRLTSFTFPPKQWALCNGQLMAIGQNQALFSILGTMYGGNGQTTFALPDLRGRAALHMGGSYNSGSIGGEEFHTLLTSEMPTHNHQVNASDVQGNQTNVQGTILAREVGNPYGNFTSLTSLAPASIGFTGGSHGHENRQPFLVISFMIALQGIFPSRS